MEKQSIELGRVWNPVLKVLAERYESVVVRSDRPDSAWVVVKAFGGTANAEAYASSRSPSGVSLTVRAGMTRRGFGSRFTRPTPDKVAEAMDRLLRKSADKAESYAAWKAEREKHDALVRGIKSRTGVNVTSASGEEVELRVAVRLPAGSARSHVEDLVKALDAAIIAHVGYLGEPRPISPSAEKEKK